MFWILQFGSKSCTYDFLNIIDAVLSQSESRDHNIITAIDQSLLLHTHVAVSYLLLHALIFRLKIEIIELLLCSSSICFHVELEFEGENMYA